MLQPGVLQCLLCCWTSVGVHAQQTAHKVYKALVLRVQSLPQAGALRPEELIAALQAWQHRNLQTVHTPRKPGIRPGTAVLTQASRCHLPVSFQASSKTVCSGQSGAARATRDS